MNILSKWARREEYVAGAVALLLITTACSGGSVKADSGSGKASDNIKLGYLLSLTGVGAQFGNQAQRGADIAVDQANKAGKVHVSVTVQDDQSTATAGVSALNQLINTQGIKAVLGPAVSIVGVPVAPIANRHKVVLLSPWVSAPAFTSEGGYTLRDHPLITELEGDLGKYASTTLGYKKVSVLYNQTPDATAAAEAFKKAFTGSGGNIVDNEVVEPGVTDFRSQLTKIAGHETDALYVFLTAGNDVGLAFKQARSLGIKAHLLAPNVVWSPDFIKSAGSAGEGTTFIAEAFDATSTDPATQQFVKEFNAKYHEEPDIVAANSYDAVNLLLEAIQKVGYDGTAIRDWLHSVEGYQGIGGKISFTSTGNVKGKSLSVMTVKDGKFVKIDTVQAG